MKKLILALVCMVGFTLSSQAQISENAIGLRFGGGNGYGAEISYQNLLSDNNRLELDLGFRNEDHFDSFKLTGLYQWVWNIEGGFYWYVGLGAGIGSVNADYPDYPDYDDGVFLSLDGNIGIEYNFNIPLQLALDFRPEFVISDYGWYDDFGPDLALALRYRF